MGGKAKKPDPPPPMAAPVRADSGQGEQAYSAASNRMGLRKTIDPVNPLAPKTALGAAGALGSGNVQSGVMVNTVAPRPNGNTIFSRAIVRKAIQDKL
ncbi:hypothetical protein UFOVP301_14 [uncultured Caudovirales phage]|uniref:Uncharacterized protein n=1 Tax=uncultured Caudovirales phage TaxID=2100421 RepID=A0A6J5RYN3_9CAUD|nr:hypothetical protein UFOVP301_14 [uncultured Caudovirales phage]CAB4150680.1 hypothetical protein UFOVP576_14 [uncultured Caudovirales phage]CAB4199597.1 hypothetical protein UFOVP1350_23 [uncultured Caudovirales phage]